MTNILLEIDEAMRWERIEKFWKANGNYIIAFVAMTILFTAISSGWSAWNEHVRTKDTEHLMSLLSDSHFPDNIKPEALHMRAPLRGMALINGAGKYMQTGKNAEALKLYTQAADDTSIPREIRHLAILMKVRLMVADPKSQGDFDAMLQPVVTDGKSPWRDYGLLEAAALAADRAHDFTKARGYLKNILERQNALPSIHAKADALDRIYAAKEKPGQKS